MGEEVEAWRAVAAGWERHRELAWASTRPVSERLVELLDPQPGETILDLAAGPGDTGFLAAPRLQLEGLELEGVELILRDAPPPGDDDA